MSAAPGPVLWPVPVNGRAVAADTEAEVEVDVGVPWSVDGSGSWVSIVISASAVIDGVLAGVLDEVTVTVFVTGPG